MWTSGARPQSHHLHFREILIPLSFFGEEEAIILGYQEDTLAQWQAANVIMGTGPPTGVLPVEPPLR